jgi:glycerophosphoryl diester phosphodiesterase
MASPKTPFHKAFHQILGVFCALALIGGGGAAPAKAAAVDTVVSVHGNGAVIAPDNSAAMLLKAVEIGAKQIHIDVQFTADEVAVLNHDDKILSTSARTCTNVGESIHLMSYEQVAQVRCDGQPLPTLDEVLALAAPHDLLLNVEIKWYSGQSKASKAHYGELLIAKLAPAQLTGGWRIESRYFRQTFPVIRAAFPSAYLIAVESSPATAQPSTVIYQDIRDAKALGASAFELNAEYAQRSFIDFIRAQGLEPYLWTVNSEAAMRFAMATGVVSVCTDYPVEMQAVKDAVAGKALQAAPTLTAVKAKTVLSKTLKKNVRSYPKIIGAKSLVPAAAQQLLHDVKLKVTASGSGRLDIAPRNSRVGKDGVRVALTKKSRTMTIYVSPGDKGGIRVFATGKAKIKIQVTGYRTASYVPSS